MNPFMHDPVAKPLSDRPAGSWRFPFSPNRHCKRLSHRAGALALAAGVGASAGLPLSAQAIDVNTASQIQLQAVKGVGPRTAQIIVQERARAGHFESLEDLSDRVRGIGAKKLQAMQAGGLRVGELNANKSLLMTSEPTPSQKKAHAVLNTNATPLITPAP